MIAASHGNVAIVRKLIQYGANLNLTNKVNQPYIFQSVCTVIHIKVQSLLSWHVISCSIL